MPEAWRAAAGGSMSNTSESGAAMTTQRERSDRSATGGASNAGERANLAGAAPAQTADGVEPVGAPAMDIPARGWKDFLWRVYENFNNNRVMAVAAGVTFYALLALFPALAALVSLYGLFADPGTIGKHLYDLSTIVPSGATEIIGDELNRVAANSNRTLGLAFVVSLAISLWSSNAGIKALFDALNVVHGEQEKRGFIKLNAMSLLFTAGAICFLLLALAAMVALPAVLGYVGLSAQTDLIIRIGRWPLLLVFVTLALSVHYPSGFTHGK